MKYKTEIMEMARIACASIHDDLQEQMDISDDLFIEIRDYIQEEMIDEVKSYFYRYSRG